MMLISPFDGAFLWLYTELCDECVKEDLFEDDLWENPTHDPDHVYIEN